MYTETLKNQHADCHHLEQNKQFCHSLYGHWDNIIMLWWVEPLKHMVVVVCACVHARVCNSVRRFLDEHQKLSTEDCHTSTTWYSLAANLTRFLIYRCILELYVWIAHFDNWSCQQPSCPQHSTFQHPRCLPRYQPSLCTCSLQLTHKCCWHMLQSLCTQTGPWLHCCLLLLVTLLACSCKLLHCGVPGQWRTSLPPHHLHSWQLTNL